MKHTYFIPILVIFFLIGCTDNNTGLGTSVDNEKELETSSFSCDNDLQECNDELIQDSINGVLKINPTLCSLQEINPNKYEEIFLDYDERNDTISNASLEIREDGAKDLQFTIQKNNNSEVSGKNINIMYDLTYFSGNEDIEQDVYNERIRILKDIIKNGINGEMIDFGDTIMLSYIGTSDYGEASEGKKNFAISEQDQFLLKREDNNVSGSYKIVFDCEVNDRKNTLRVYYNSEGNLGNTNESGNNIRQVSNIDILETELSDTVNEKYISGQYNRGTFLLESLNKNNNFINGSGSINVLISDMFFQLHPTMKENKNITGASYDFTLDTIKKLESDSDFRNFYINSIPDYLGDKCNNNEEVLIYGANLSDDLDTKRIMKEYYEDYFFKRCRVSFNS